MCEPPRKKRCYVNVLSPFQCLPSELLLKIFLYATKDDLFTLSSVARVCTNWREFQKECVAHWINEKQLLLLRDFKRRRLKQAVLLLCSLRTFLKGVYLSEYFQEALSALQSSFLTRFCPNVTNLEVNDFGSEEALL